MKTNVMKQFGGVDDITDVLNFLKSGVSDFGSVLGSTVDSTRQGIGSVFTSLLYAPVTVASTAVDSKNRGKLIA